MPIESIAYRETGYFSPLILDYLDENPTVKPLYHRFPSLENLSQQADEKKATFPMARRESIVNALKRQYDGVSSPTAVQANLDALLQDTTFTVTTGHQLSLFTGPAYFLYKIVTTIRLANMLSKSYPDKKFVPVYWMATEDHDFEEICQFRFHGKKFRWNREAGGATGRMDLKGLDIVFELFSKEAGDGRHADELRRLFKDAYLSHNSLAAATRHLVNDLFGQNGLVIVDGDDPDLKRIFAPWMAKEVSESFSHKAVTATIAKMGDYKIQVNPREINLFYLGDDYRSRIVRNGERLEVLDTTLSFSDDEMRALLDASPEKISPNVILRPLYQEVILPNICYIGGGGEIAYWLELKAMFEVADVPFPILLLRNSVVMGSEKQQEKAARLGLTLSDLFRDETTLQDLVVSKVSAATVDFSALRRQLHQQFAILHEALHQTDPSFAGAVKAQEQKQLAGLDRLESRWRKAERRKHADVAERAVALRRELFPLGGLQERTVHFGDFYELYGEEYRLALNQLQPLDSLFSILVMP